MAFWSVANLDPKRKFRWVLTFSELGTSEYVAKTVSKPVWNIEGTEHKFINHTFKYPGRVTWDDIEVTFADPGGDDDVTTILAALLHRSGYSDPLNSQTSKDSVTKGEAVGSLGEVTIQQLGADEGSILETWRLENAWCAKVSFGDLSYDDEGLTELSMTLKYDWATYEGPGNVVGGG